MKTPMNEPGINHEETVSLYTLSPGQILQERYRVEKLLGEGGMGKVYLCQNLKLGNFWAIKHIQTEKYHASHLQVEADILKQLNHLSLPKIVDRFQDHTGLYMVESYIEGVSLKEKMQKEGPFKEGLALEWGIQLAEVLSYLHTLKPHPIIYQDMKPSNVMITQQNRVVIIDFGISRELQNHQLTSIGLTDAFAAPEQLRGQGDERSDIYSLALMLSYLMTGSTDRQTSPCLKKIGASQSFMKIIEKAVNPSPEMRYQTIEELKKALQIHRENFEKRYRPAAKYSLPVDYKKLVLCISPESTGKTSIAVNLSWQFSQLKVNTCLIDLDFDKRDVYYHFSHPPQESHHDSSRGEGFYKKPNKINEFLQVYTAHPEVNLSGQIHEMIPLLLRVKAGSQMVVVDVGAHWKPEEINQLIPIADHVLLVVDQRVGLMNRLQDFLVQLELRERTMDLLINRYVANTPIGKGTLKTCCSLVETADERKKIQIGSIHTIPEDFQSIVLGLAGKKPALAIKETRLSSPISNLAAQLFPVMGNQETGFLKKVRGLFR